MRNAEVAHALREIADLLEMQEVAFKPAAYRKAARNVADLPEPIEDVADRGELEEIPGVGRAIADKVAELLSTGHLRYLEELKGEMPVDVEALTRVQGLGPRKVKALHEALGIGTLDELEAAARAGRIAGVAGFGERSQARILAGIPLARAGVERTLLGRAIPLVADLLGRLRATDAFDELEAVGSFRRRLPTVGDLDLLATAPDPAAAMDALAGSADVAAVLSKGPAKTSVRLAAGIQVDLRVVERRSLGAALLYFTGSRDHNIALRTRAEQRGLKLNEYGLHRGDERLAGATEAEVMEALGLAYIPPELREDRGEIQAAEAGDLPDLLTLDDIRGDLQMHTTWSDGADAVLDMAQAADERGYEYILLTDHGPGLPIAGGMSLDEIQEQRQEIAEAQDQVDVRILQGVEAEVLAGGLDVPADVCAELDLVVASCHAATDDATERLLSVIEDYPVDIVGHPTNRLIGQREGNALDLDRLADACAANRVALEINGQPDRLDLDWRSVEDLRGRVKFSLGTDAHGTAGLANMELAVAMARKGWLEAADVINTLSLDELRKAVGR